MGLTKEEANKIIVVEDTIVAYIVGAPVFAENLQNWAYRRLEAFPKMLDALHFARGG